MGTRVSPGTVSNLSQKICQRIDKWCNRQINEPFTYLYLDGVVLKRMWAEEFRNISVLAAIGVIADTATAKSSASLKGPKRTRSVGAVFCAN